MKIKMKEFTSDNGMIQAQVNAFLDRNPMAEVVSCCDGVAHNGWAIHRVYYRLPATELPSDIEDMD